MKILLALLLLFAAQPAYAQRACTEIGCVNGVTFTSSPGFDWKNGQYDIRVALDYKTVVCRGELPLHPCGAGPTFTCDDPSVRIGESGCALPDNQHGISDIYINDDPKKIMISVMRNARTIITRTVVPQYQTSMPNGAGCGPVCRSASFQLLSADTVDPAK
jgi:hypothetical protein